MRLMFRVLVVSAAAAGLLATASAEAGQYSDAFTDPTQALVTPGWNFTPSLLLSRTYDDNVFVHTPGTGVVHDYINTIDPRGDVNYIGDHGMLAARYDGAFVSYTDLSSLNSYDQRGTIIGRRQLSTRTSIFVDASASSAPTTETLLVTGVPWVRLGTFADDVRGGFERLMTRKLTLTVTGHFTQAIFDDSQAFSTLLLGGSSVGADVTARQRISSRTSLLAEADVQHATIGSARETFDITYATAGIERQLSEGFRAFASGGVAYLGASDFGPARTGPSWKIGVNEHYRSALFEVTVNRSFVPSFGFGGAMRNQDVTGRLRTPLSRRLYTQVLVSWAQEDPLAIEVPQLRTVWVQSTLGYAFQPWLRFEGFFTGTRQQVGAADNLLRHDQAGIQIIASKPMRIR